MNKKARELMKQINNKKNAIRGLQGQGKTQEMKDQMNELRQMQEEFEMMMELDEDEKAGIENQIKDGAEREVSAEKKKYTKNQIVKAFVNQIVCGLRKTEMTEEDREIMTSVQDAMSEGSDEDGGLTVPSDIQTDIYELRRTSDDLEQYVNREPVTTKDGSRVFEIEADATPWKDVEEGAEFQEEATPQLEKIVYKITKKGGILKVTRELLKDSAENILGFLNKWIAKKSRATRNAAILKVMNKITEGKEIAVSDCDDLKDIFNTVLDPAIADSSIVITNQNGFNYLDKLKDKDGNYIMQPDVTDKTKMLLFGAYPIKKISNKVLKSEGVKKGGSGADKDTIVSYKHPVFIGDTKEAITLFDREKISIEISTVAGDLWNRDQTGIKVRDRFDVQPVDKGALVKGEISVGVAG